MLRVREVLEQIKRDPARHLGANTGSFSRLTGPRSRRTDARKRGIVLEYTVLEDPEKAEVLITKRRVR